MTFISLSVAYVRERRGSEVPSGADSITVDLSGHVLRRWRIDTPSPVAASKGGSAYPPTDSGRNRVGLNVVGLAYMLGSSDIQLGRKGIVC